MADQASIFTDPNAQNTNAGTQTTSGGNGGTSGTDDLTTLLSAIKNPDGQPKYKTVQEALKALQHSQEYIPTLKQTKEELEARLLVAEAAAAKVNTLEQTLLQLTQRSNEPTQTTPAGLTEEQIAELVNRTLSKTQQEAVQKQNLTTVVDVLKSKFGEKAEQVFYDKAKELGLSVAEFNAMAAKTPKAVLSLVGATGTPNTSTPSPGFNTDGFQKRPESAITSNKVKSIMLGATTQDLHMERQNANALVEELHAAGRSVHDLSDPKVYFKHFS
jgi:hypothetical protein